MYILAVDYFDINSSEGKVGCAIISSFMLNIGENRESETSPFCFPDCCFAKLLWLDTAIRVWQW